MSDVNLSSINVLAELERMGWEYEFVADSEVKVRCPAHADKTPSCSLNTENKLWKCHSAGCEARGDFVTFMTIALKTTRVVILEDLASRYDFDEVKVLDGETIERYHALVWNAGPLLNELRKRGLNDDDIRKYRIGFDRGRLTIPIPNEAGHWVNVRRYLPGAPTNEKMKNTRGHGAVRLFPMEQLKYDEIVIVGGECKAIVTARHLNPHGIGAITCTAGEGNWEPEFSKRMRGKRVWVGMDIDDAGREAGDRVAARIKNDAEWVGVIQLPLDRDRYPHGDWNDWFGPIEHRTAVETLDVLKRTPPWAPRIVSHFLKDGDTLSLPLFDATKAEHVGKRVTIKGIVQAMDPTPYIVPRTVQCECDRNQPFCAACPVFAHTPHDDGFVELHVHPESSAIINMVNTGKKEQRSATREALGIPQCKTVQFKVMAHHNVEVIHVVPQLEVAVQQSDGAVLPAMVVSHGTEVGTAYAFTGRVYPHPRSQQAIMLMSGSKPAEDALNAYAPNDEELADLAVFRPDAWTVEAIQSKLNEVYDDLEANVTRVFMRRDLHLMVDLAYHSVLTVPFDGRAENGWVQVLILGDSSQGKSETVRQYMLHIGLGAKVECKNASAAGLIGGLQQYGNKWLVTRGLIPTHDRRLVVLEELKGASTETIGRLTDMRSTGVAEIDKIEKRKMLARTRMIAVSNPRSDGAVAAYNYGVDAVRELIGGPEDIRRFDAALVISSTQINPKVLNRLSRQRPVVEHRFTAQRSQRLVLWAWTRSVEQVVFEDGAQEAVLDQANAMCGKFVEAIPLVDSGSMRLKLARLAASLACRTFSTTGSSQVVCVRRCHVEYVAAALDRIYSDPVFGYADFSSAYRTTFNLVDPEVVERKVLATPFPGDFVEQLLHTDSIELRDIQDLCGWERGPALDLLSVLVRKHALRRDQNSPGYRKTPQFIELLKSLRGSDKVKAATRPEHIKEEY